MNGTLAWFVWEYESDDDEPELRFYEPDRYCYRVQAVVIIPVTNGPIPKPE